MKAENGATLLNEFPNIFDSYVRKYRNPHPGHIFSVGDGWFMILWDMAYHLRELQSKIPFIEINVLQVKEKFGGLRFYYQCEYKDESWGSKKFRQIDEWVRTQMCKNGFHKVYWALTKFRKKHIYKTVFEKVGSIIGKGEAESYKVCEICGEPGKRCSPTGWISTLCEKHEIERKKENEEWEKSFE